MQGYIRNLAPIPITIMFFKCIGMQFQTHSFECIHTRGQTLLGISMIKIRAKRRMFLFQAPRPPVVETEEDSTRRLGE